MSAPQVGSEQREQTGIHTTIGNPVAPRDQFRLGDLASLSSWDFIPQTMATPTEVLQSVVPVSPNVLIVCSTCKSELATTWWPALSLEPLPYCDKCLEKAHQNLRIALGLAKTP